jgi:catechol 2,3-dioxygenase-like lactoylglutathione lyase family enzyme
VKAADLFHTGVVVHDLDRALAELSALFGYDWCEEIHVDQPVQTPDGDTSVEFRFRYSRSTPRLEVIEQRPGTLWVPVAGSGIHHLGYWSDDVAADSAAMTAAGYTFEAAGTGPDGGPSWSYYRSPDGPRIELVSRSLEPFMAMMWA